MTPLYGINSARSRFEIIRDHAKRHNLTVQQVDELVRQLPDYGARSMFHASLAVLTRNNVVDLASRRDLLRNNRENIGDWTADRDGAA